MVEIELLFEFLFVVVGFSDMFDVKVLLVGEDVL